MAFASCRPDYVEQPVAASDIAGLVQVAQQTGIAVAADEAAGSPERARACLEAGVRVLVLKPAVLGGLRATAAIAQEAAAHGARVVLTSVLDRGLATAGALHLAAALGTTEPCGLATGACFVEPAVEGLALSNGALEVPLGSGLGVTPLAEELCALIEEVRHAAMAHA
jgi:L-alanine-DL-glutamate epimerase-like enolase superfamily enzyme